MRLERFLDRLQDLGVGLLQLQLDVDFVVAAGLIGHVALAGVVLHRRLQRLDPARPEDLAALLEQRVLVDLHVHRNRDSRTWIASFASPEHQIITSRRGRAAYSARSVASGLSRRTSRLERTPMAATRIAVSATPAACSPAKIRHGMSSAYRLTPHVSPIAPSEPTRPASDPEHAVFDQQHPRDRPRVGAERLEDRRLVDALELRHRHRADEDQHAAEEHQRRRRP